MEQYITLDNLIQFMIMLSAFGTLIFMIAKK